MEEEDEDVALIFEEAGTKHRLVYNVDEAPRVSRHFYSRTLC